MTGELIRLGDTTVRFLVEGADSGGTVAVFEVGITARGKMPAPHSHDSFEETIYGLEGVSTWTVEGAAVDVAPGEALCIPRGAVHHFDNHGDLDAKALRSSRRVCSAPTTSAKSPRCSPIPAVGHPISRGSATSCGATG